MSWLKRFFALFKKAETTSKPELSSAQVAQNIRDAIPAALDNIDGLTNLKVVIMRSLDRDQELFNAINRTLPLTAPSEGDRFDYLSQICDMIEGKTPRGDILEILRLVNF